MATVDNIGMTEQMMFYRFGTTPLAIYGKSLLGCDMKLGDFGIELTHGAMVLAYAPKDESVQLLILGGAEGGTQHVIDKPYAEQTQTTAAMVFRDVDWRLSQKRVDTCGETPAIGSIIITIEEPMMIAAKRDSDDLQAIGLRSGNVYALTTEQHMRLCAKDWRLDGFVDQSLVVTLFENEAAAG